MVGYEVYRLVRALQSARFKKEAKQMLTYISNFKSSVPSAHGFSARELMTTVLRRPTVASGMSLLCGMAAPRRMLPLRCFGLRIWLV